MRTKPAVWALLAAACAAAPPEGLTPERQRMIEDARQVALNYSNSLANFLCTEEIRREIDWNESGKYTPADRIQARVTYYDGRETYQLIGRGGKLEHIAGAISLGEFGSTLRSIFDPAAQAEFEWEGAATVRNRPVSVFTYRVEGKTSRLKMAALSRSVIVGFHGTVSIDNDRRVVLALTVEAEGPEGFPIRDSFTALEYDWTEIARQRYLVPVAAEIRMTENPAAKRTVISPAAGASVRESAKLLTRYRNRIQFRDYRRFAAETKLGFGRK